jgi:hypothetical protein
VAGVDGRLLLVAPGRVLADRLAIVLRLGAVATIKIYFCYILSRNQRCFLPAGRGDLVAGGASVSRPRRRGGPQAARAVAARASRGRGDGLGHLFVFLSSTTKSHHNDDNIKSTRRGERRRRSGRVVAPGRVLADRHAVGLRLGAVANKKKVSRLFLITADASYLPGGAMSSHGAHASDGHDESADHLRDTE